MLFGVKDGKIKSLRGVPLFSGLGGASLRLIAAHVDEARVDADTVLARQDRVPREFVLVVDGCVRVERDGRAVGHLKAGDWFGELALLEAKPHEATIIAETPVRLIVVEARSFSYLLAQVPELRRRLSAMRPVSSRPTTDEVAAESAELVARGLEI